MGPRVNDKRERLIDSAKQLIYTQGYNQTTLADIAEHSGVPLGNVYYYFKTKDEIGEAVIKERYQDVCKFMSRCEQYEHPKDRLFAILDGFTAGAAQFAKHGCPIGSLCQELGKAPSPLSVQANGIVREQIAWATRQFEQMACDDPEALGVRLIADMHGACLTTYALGEAEVMQDQMEGIKGWVKAL